MTHVTNKSFIWWFVAFTTGMVLWAWPSDLPWYFLGGLIVVFSGQILVSAQERSRQMGKREPLQLLCLLAVLIAVMVAAKLWLPEQVETRAFGFIRHPAFVVPLWALFVWFSYRRFQKTKKNANDAA